MIRPTILPLLLLAAAALLFVGCGFIPGATPTEPASEAPSSTNAPPAAAATQPPAATPITDSGGSSGQSGDGNANDAANAGAGSGPTPEAVVSGGNSVKQWPSPPSMTIDPASSYTAVLNTSAGSITAELLPAEAPNTVNNFVFLARQGFYDNVIFHRTIPGFMIQGGDPSGTGAGGPGYTFADEPVQRPYTRGVLAMANAGPNTNGSQFFIMHADYPLPPNYTIFGQAVAGLETVDAIANAPTQPGGEGSTPVNPVVIQSVEIVGP